MRVLRNFGLFIFLAASLVLVYFYCRLLYLKIEQPGFKNLDTKSLAWVGVVLLTMVVADALILHRFVAWCRAEMRRA